MKTDRDFMPIYYHIAEDLKLLIESGQLKHGDPVPSESQLVNDYRVSRVTVRRGLAILLEAGLIETVKGKGNFVARPKLSQVTLEFKERDYIKEKDLSYKLMDVRRITVDSSLAAKLNVPEGTKVFFIKRLIKGKKGPVGLDLKFLPYLKGKPMLENEIDYADFPDIVAKHVDVTIHRIEMSISAVPLMPEDAELLETVTGHPALCVKQLIQSKDGRTLGVSNTVYRGEALELNAVSYPYYAKV